MSGNQVGISGASGLIGRQLCERLLGQSCHLTLLGRAPQQLAQQIPEAHIFPWDVVDGPPPVEAVNGLDAFIHLAGSNIAVGRWTSSFKNEIEASRVMGTRNLITAFQHADQPPATLISASAVGFYGDGEEELLTEEAAVGNGFLAETCAAWEAEARRAGQLGVRVILLRCGVVLSRKGGALSRMLLPFRLFVGGPLGNGRQYLSWIHIDDAIGLIDWALVNKDVEGPLNCTAPEPVTNGEFSRLAGKLIGRPAFLRTPGFVLKLLLGEMAQELLLEGQRAVPAKAEKLGFSFRFGRLEEALGDLLEGKT